MDKPILISIISICIIFAATTIGSALVFFFKKSLSEKFKSIILGFAGGIMMAAALFGLIIPSIDQSNANPIYSGWNFVPPIVGFLFGGVLLFGLDKLVPHFHKLQNVEEGLSDKSLSENFKFFLAVTIHNIPEGLSVGFACGLALSLSGSAAIVSSLSALSLAIGIAIQNIPEGAAVSIPMFSDGMKKGKAFLFGTVSGVVEPIFAVFGLFLAKLSLINPWLLALAAGSMIYVTLDEILPEARENGLSHYGMWSFMIGFAVMMTLEITLG